MNSAYFALSAVFILTVATAVYAGDDDYVYHMQVCDNRCELKHRMNPFAGSCDDCCKNGGSFKKGKCKGFGWSNCMCKRHGQIRQLFNAFLNNNLPAHGQQGYGGYQG